MKTVEPIREIRQIQAMRTVLRDQSIRNELLFVLGINSGLRISDILSLKAGDVFRAPSKAREDLTIVEKKTGKTKRVYLGDTVKKLLERYYQQEHPSMDDYLFPSRKHTGLPIRRERAWEILNQAAELIGLVDWDNDGKLASGRIGTHTLRKTFGYHAYQSGVDLALLQDLFNHSSERTTLRYIGITEENKKAVYLRLDLG
ncbi:site-specific integrase [Alicyclobacillaceae bacterium I2511]|nr:site-specific integrase [Alicyclobacillaceae bacterium I2511]